MTFGKRLKQLREERGLGVREFSRLTGLSLSHLHYLEHDDRTPGDETLRRIARHLDGVSVRDLIAEREERRLETDLSVLLRDAESLTQAQREQLLEIAQKALSPTPVKSAR